VNRQRRLGPGVSNLQARISIQGTAKELIAAEQNPAGEPPSLKTDTAEMSTPQEIFSLFRLQHHHDHMYDSSIAAWAASTSWARKI
jgi:hypothetical protein